MVSRVMFILLGAAIAVIAMLPTASADIYIPDTSRKVAVDGTKYPTATVTRTPTRTPTPTKTPGACGTPQQVVLNPGFEQAGNSSTQAAGWSAGRSNVRAHTGLWSTRPDNSQNIHIPTWATSGILSMWVYYAMPADEVITDDDYLTLFLQSDLLFIRYFNELRIQASSAVNQWVLAWADTGSVAAYRNGYFQLSLDARRSAPNQTAAWWVDEVTLTFPC